MTARIGVRSKLSRAVVIATAAAVLGAGCADDKTPASGVVDLAELDVGGYATAPRPVHDQPSLPEGTLLEGIRMAEAVADSSQFDSPLLYLWRADPIPHTASLTPVLGEAGKGVLDRHGWIAGYRASYADRPQLPDGNAPPAYVGLSILLLRFSDEAAARGAAAALEVTNWKDLPRTVAVALPNHPDVSARYTPGSGALLVDTAVGPFVVHLLLEAPPDGIETRVRDLDPVIDAQRRLIANFGTTPVAEIPALPRDPDGLLARMVSTDPTHQPPVSATFAVYGPTGALRDQTPMIRKDKLYEKWGVDRFAVSGDQHLYRLRDHQAALAMRDEFIAESSGREHPIEADPKVPDERCFQVNNPLPNTPAFACRVIVDSLYTVVRGDTATSAKQKAAAQYALLAAGR